MMGFVITLVKILLCGGFAGLLFKLFNSVSFDLNDEWYCDFMRFVFALCLLILFICLCIVIML